MPAATPQQDQGITKSLKGGDVNLQVRTAASFKTAVNLLGKFDLLDSTAEVKMLLDACAPKHAGFDIQFNKVPSPDFEARVMNFAKQLAQSRV